MAAVPSSTRGSLIDRVRDAKKSKAQNNDEAQPHSFVTMVAPMVRYSKLPFRLLCRRYDADIAFTPMIVADTFNRSQKARDSEFSSHESDRPLVVQFAANDPIELGAAAEKCVGYADAVDINCGCPQRWAMADGLGAALMKQPQLIKEMVAETRKRSGLPCSVKIRVHEDIRKTIDLVQQVESVGVEWVTVHGRTAKERTSPVRLESIKTIKDIARVPIIANGDVFDPSDFDRIVSATGVDGLMSARGILSNPALFAGYAQPPVECLQYYVQLALEYGGSFPIHHHHLMCMLAPRLWKGDRTEFSRIQSISAVIDFFDARGWWTPSQAPSLPVDFDVSS